MANAIIILAEGFETIEALTPLDVFKRCGIETITASLAEEKMVRSSHGLLVEATTTMQELLDSGVSAEADALILPGGYPGYRNLCQSAEVGSLAKEFFEKGKLLCAICGAPTVLKANGIAPGASITCHSSVKEEMAENYCVLPSAVIRYMNIITGMGAGHSLEFALTIAERLVGTDKTVEVRTKMELF